MYARTKSAGAVAVLAVLLAGCTGTGTPIPQDSSTSAPAAKSVSAPSPVKKAAKPRVSSCDQVREAFLTGSKADVTKSLKRLKADRSADGTAREYAGYYLGRDSGSKDLRQMDQTLIVSSCEL